MSKGIAINTILYLLIGVLVVGVVVYLVYTYVTGAGLDSQSCRSIVQNWCTSCKIANWADDFGTITGDSDMEKCVDTYFSTSWDPFDMPVGADCYDDAEADDKTEEFCAQFIS